ncbi:hypothetical protein KY359_02680 [Candidatus Woesearchaeota archaeon]|nr:hypothetical protein [Candidatus Woesearchaeota archaeon]
MKEKTLLAIALAVGIMGMAALFILAQRIEIDQVMLDRLDEMVDEAVVVEGVVVGVNEAEGAVFLMLQKDEMVDVVLFGDAPLLEEGDYVQVRGTVSSHEGETGIIGEEVRVI